MEQMKELLGKIEDEVGDLQQCINAALVAMHADDLPGEDDEETQAIVEGRYAIMWEAIPKARKIIREIAGGIHAIRCAAMGPAQTGGVA